MLTHADAHFAGGNLEGNLCKEGVKWLLKAAQAGHLEAMFSVAVRYTSGVGQARRKSDGNVTSREEGRPRRRRWKRHAWQQCVTGEGAKMSMKSDGYVTLRVTFVHRGGCEDEHEECSGVVSEGSGGWPRECG
eukprot:2407613-Pyramimonas_sp.AAC.2